MSQRFTEEPPVSDSVPSGGSPEPSPIRPLEWPVSCTPSTEDEDQSFALLLAHIARLPRAERWEMVAFLALWFDLPRQRRALLAKAAHPDMTDDQVGRLVGRHARTLRRWDRYQDLKPRRSDLRGSRRYRGLSNPDDPDA
jgi:hypothetical protein